MQHPGILSATHVNALITSASAWHIRVPSGAPAKPPGKGASSRTAPPPAAAAAASGMELIAAALCPLVHGARLQESKVTC